VNKKKRIVIRKTTENNTIKELRKQLEENTKYINKLNQKLKEMIKNE
jgi:uncharacterized coiled-coil protein SlyX